MDVMEVCSKIWWGRNKCFGFVLGNDYIFFGRKIKLIYHQTLQSPPLFKKTEVKKLLSFLLFLQYLCV